MENVSNQMYAKLPNLVLGFHGCHKDVFESVIKNGQHLKRSENDYDWLGNGIYISGKTAMKGHMTGQRQGTAMMQAL